MQKGTNNMEKDDQDWIDAHLDEPITEQSEDFEGVVFLSTDGKHTVSFTAKTTAGRYSGLKWSKKIFDRLMEVYGSKQQQSVKEYKKAEATGEDLGVCPKCGAPNKRSQKGKVYCGNTCWIK